MSRPLPTQLKIIRGTNRPGRSNKAEPKPEIQAPSCPDSLSLAAKAEWRRMAPLLVNMGLLSKLDRSALAGYCELYARWTKAEKEVQHQGEVITTPNGSLQVSPWLSIANRSLSEMRKYMAEFGLSPASRSKVTATPKNDKYNEWANF